MPLRLICLRGPLAGEVFLLNNEPLSFGRASQNTIKITNRLASRNHAEVRREDGNYVLYDQKSHNGIRVNGALVTVHILRPGDEITIGDEAFRVEELTSDSTLPVGPQITCLHGPLAGKTFPLNNEPLSFGRSPDSTIKIASKLSSRHHAEVRREQAGYVLYDHKSQNGTMVNNVRVTNHTLRPGDEITIADELFLFNILAHETDSTQISPFGGQSVADILENPSAPVVLPTWNPMQVTLEFTVTRSKVSIAWRCSFMGEHVTSFASPYDPNTLPLVLQALDVMQYPEYPHIKRQFTESEQATLTTLGLWKDNRVAADAYTTVGRDLYTALGYDGRWVIDTIRNYGIHQRRSISYVLRFPKNGISLAMLPWELLADSHQPLLIGRQRVLDSCERYLNLPQAIPEPLEAGQKLHLLALSPAYGISDEVRQEERVARLKTWNKLKDAGLITFDEITPLTRRSLTEYLQTTQRQVDIVHYFGHGSYKDGEGYLMFDDGDTGQSMVSASKLAAQLGDVRLVMLHACQSATFNQENSMLTGVAPALSLATSAVVGMQFTVRIEAATRFAEVFYDTLLLKRRSLQEAVALGRQTLFFEEQDSVSWFVPTLYIRSRDQRPIYMMQDDQRRT